jgi:hypothetical protein
LAASLGRKMARIASSMTCLPTAPVCDIYTSTGINRSKKTTQVTWWWFNEFIHF